MTEASPFEPPVDGSFVATLKQGKGYEDSWLVIRGSTAAELKARIIAAFGFDDAAELSLVEVIHNASQDFQGMGNVGRGLGGRVVSSRAQAATSGDDPWVGAAAAVAEAENVDPNKRMLDEIKAAEHTDVLKRFWVEHQPLNPVVMAAWSAKGKVLKEKESN